MCVVSRVVHLWMCGCVCGVVDGTFIVICDQHCVWFGPTVTLLRVGAAPRRLDSAREVRHGESHTKNFLPVACLVIVTSVHTGSFKQLINEYET